MFDLTQPFAEFIKIMIIAIEAIYVLFAFMLTQQIKIMNRNFNTTLAPTFSLLALIHFLATIGLLVFSILAR